MKKYEAVFILDDQKFDDDTSSFTRRLGGLIDDMGGNLVDTCNMGTRQFAHPVKKKSSGHYWDYIVELPGDGVTKLKDKFRLDASVLRLEIFSYEEPPSSKAEKKVDVLLKDDTKEEHTDD